MSIIRTRVIVAVTAILLSGFAARAQLYSNIYSFSSPGFDSAYGASTNSDGIECVGGVVLSGDVLYGTTWNGGTNGNGTIYSVQTNGSQFTVLHTFGAPYLSTIGQTNADGAHPQGTLAVADGWLYGTTFQGGPLGYGTVFKMNADGSGFTNLQAFALGTNAVTPSSGLIVVGDTIYGTAPAGGSAIGNFGTVFAMKTNGLGYTNVHSFSGLANDGAEPNASVVCSNGVLYGTTTGGGGGSAATGVIFSVNTNGTGYTNLYVFRGKSKPATTSTNNLGESPYTGLVISGGTLYGTTKLGGTNGNGIIFSIGINGDGFNAMHVFGFAKNNSNGYTNSDGAYPLGNLYLSDNTLYGTTSEGGTNGSGVIFSIQTDGTNFTNVYTFYPITVISGTNFYGLGGATPVSGLVEAGGVLYGATEYGGLGFGNVYDFNLTATNSGTISGPTPVPLSIQWFSGYVLLQWSDPRFTLQSAPSMSGPFTLASDDTSPAIIAATETEQFFRLIAN